MCYGMRKRRQLCKFKEACASIPALQKNALRLQESPWFVKLPLSCHLPLFRIGIFDSWRSSWRCTSKVPRSEFNPRGYTVIHLLDSWQLLSLWRANCGFLCYFHLGQVQRPFAREHLRPTRGTFILSTLGTLTHRTSHARCRWHHILFSLDYTAQTSRVLKQDGQLYSCWCCCWWYLDWSTPQHRVLWSKLRAVLSEQEHAKVVRAEASLLCPSL